KNPDGEVLYTSAGQSIRDFPDFFDYKAGGTFDSDLTDSDELPQEAGEPDESDEIAQAEDGGLPQSGAQHITKEENPKKDPFGYDIKENEVVETELNPDGSSFSTIRMKATGTEYLVYSCTDSSENTVEIRVQKEFIEQSASVAGKFVSCIAIVCLAVSLIFILLYSRGFSRPISEMNDITKDMAALNFERRIKTSSKDEIGQLAGSINHLSDELSRTLDDLRSKNEQLEKDIELAERVDEMRKEFVANVSHELKTPIAVISGYAEGLKMSVFDRETAEKYCDVIMSESARMNDLVIDLLELSRYQSGQNILHAEAFNIQDIISDAVRAAKAKTEAEGLDISCDSRNVTVTADPVKIRTVLQNYLNNAVSHCEKNGKIRISYDDRGDRVRVSVYNDGEHISDGDAEKIWQSFYRADKSRKRGEGKSRFGLGLSIVKEIMEIHKMPYGVENTEGGVSFWFELPLAK
ncbi:MAG: ATP-binding protein, partial [Acutalibacteraceae bacterium]